MKYLQYIIFIVLLLTISTVLNAKVIPVPNWQLLQRKLDKNNISYKLRQKLKHGVELNIRGGGLCNDGEITSIKVQAIFSVEQKLPMFGLKLQISTAQSKPMVRATDRDGKLYINVEKIQQFPIEIYVPVADISKRVVSPIKGMSLNKTLDILKNCSSEHQCVYQRSFYHMLKLTQNRSLYQRMDLVLSNSRPALMHDPDCRLIRDYLPELRTQWRFREKLKRCGPRIQECF